MRKLALALLLALPLAAEPVYVSVSGKTYHRVAKCTALAKARVVLTGDRTVADQHGAKACHRKDCWPAAKTAGNAAWAKEVKDGK